jgi:Tfp pilus assembly protein PilO
MTIIILILSSFIVYAVVLPQKDVISQLKNQCETDRAYIENVSTFTRERPDYGSYLKELNKKLGTLETMLPEKAFLSEFLKETEEISKSAGVAVIDVKPHIEIQREGYSELPVEMIVRGSFEEILDFSKKLEDFRRFISITAANISHSAPGQAEKLMPELEGRFFLIIYSSAN